MKGAVALTGHRLFVGSYDHHLYALDARTGSADLARFRRRTGSAAAGRSTRPRRPRTGASTSARPTARSTRSGRASGELRWSQSTGGYVYGSPAVWNERILDRLVQRPLLLRSTPPPGTSGGSSEADGPISGSATRARRRRLLLDAEGPDVRPRRGDRAAGLELPRRQVLAGRRRARPRLYLTGYTRLYGMVPVTRGRCGSWNGSPVGLPRHELDPQRGPAADLDAEQEVDFGRYWRLIAARWWLPVGGLVAGLVIGYLVSLGTHSSTYKATAQVYLGQPLAPGGAAAGRRARRRRWAWSRTSSTAESTVAMVAAQVGPEAGPAERAHHDEAGARGSPPRRWERRRRCSRSPSRGSPPRKIADAANRARQPSSINAVSRLPDVKIAEAEGADRLRRQEHRRGTTTASRSAGAQQQAILRRQVAQRDRASSLLLANINTTLVTVEQRLGQLETDSPSAQQFLSLAQNVERRADPLAGRRGRRRPGRTAAPAPRSAA